MATAKEPKKVTRSKRANPEEITPELPQEIPVVHKKPKLSINKVHNLFPVEPEVIAEEKPKKKATKKKAEEKTKSYLISFESPSEIELLKELEAFAEYSGNSINKTILVLAEKALRQKKEKPSELFFKPAPEFGQELNENFRKVEEKIQNEIDNLKLEFLEQLQCLAEISRTQPENAKDQKGWLQNILKYI